MDNIKKDILNLQLDNIYLYHKINILSDIIINDKLINDKPINDKPINDKPINDKPINDKPINDKPINDNKIKHIKLRLIKVDDKSLKRNRDNNNEDDIILNKYLNPPKKYKYLNEFEINKELEIIFKNINSITDIINLENNINKYSFIKNSKYKKLIKLINPLKELNNLIGMDIIKEQILYHICYFIHNNEMEMMHTIITGPPGVGKTELGKILGKIYLSLNILKNNKFIEAKRSDLIAGYLGQTAIKTQKVIDSAMGGVLFIDEAYSLGNKDNSDSFSKECIDTLNQNLTENKKNFLCIIAGYKDDITNCFLKYNKGLSRRFPFVYNIYKYNSNELVEIFKKKIEKNKNINLDDNIKLNKIFKNNYHKFKNYGGDIEILLQKCCLYASKRILNNTINLDYKININKNDLYSAINCFKIEEKKDIIPDYMYI
jgi:SpoVK/Ycf46/Vps4 family AAA+-type ATPase